MIRLSVSFIVALSISTLLQFDKDQSKVNLWIGEWQEEWIVSQGLSDEQSLIPKIWRTLKYEVPTLESWVAASANSTNSCYLKSAKTLQYQGIDAQNIYICFSLPRLVASSLYSFTFVSLLIALLTFQWIWQLRHRIFLQQKTAIEIQLLHEKELSGLARKVAHDLRSPIGTLRTLFKMTHNMEPAYRELFEHSISRVNQIANDLLESSKLSKSGIMSTGSINHTQAQSHESNSKESPAACGESFSNTFRKTIKSWQIQHTNIDFHFDAKVDFLDEILPNEIKPEDVHRWLENLVNNSIESFQSKNHPNNYLIPSETLMNSSELQEIFVQLQVTMNEIVFIVQDNGCGIPEEVLQKLGSEEITHGKVQGNGLGLYSLYQSAEKISGSIKVFSKLGLGTRVELRIPKANKATMNHSAV